MRTFVVGDIHGSYRALIQCFERSGFNKEGDRLVVLGDICDGYPDVNECIDALISVKHCDLVIGNHDMWALDWAINDDRPVIWTSQGGYATIESYGGGPMPKEHVGFLKSGVLWLELNDRLFVHGGFDPDTPLTSHHALKLMWDRDLLDMARKFEIGGKPRMIGSHKEVFIGHTTTEFYRTLEPIHVCNIWAIDTGAGWSGKLTIMDVDTKEYWQSGLSMDLYGATPDRLIRKR